MKKTKPSNMDLAFQSYARSDADSRNSEISVSSFFLPSLVSKLDLNEKSEVRLSAIRSLTESFTKSCAHSRDDRMSDVAISSLRDIILAKNSKNEHNEALRLICAFSLGRRSEFSVRAKMLINDLLPSIGNLSSEYDAYRAFAISFLTANSIEGREDSLDIFKTFLDTFINATTLTIKSSKNQNKDKFQHKNKIKNQNTSINTDITENEDNDTKKNENNTNDITEGANINSNDNSNNSNTFSSITNTVSIENTNIQKEENNNNNKNNTNIENHDENEIENNIKTIKNIESPEANSKPDSIEIEQQIQDSNDNPSVTSPQAAQTNQQIESPIIINSTDSNKNDQQIQPQDTATFSLKRRSKFKGSTQSLRELLQGAALIASSLPAEAAAEDLIDELTTIISITLGADDDESNQVDPLLATDGLDLFLVVHECLIERHEELHLSQTSTNSVKNFISHFRPYIESLPRRANLDGGNKGKNKAREKSLRAKIADVLRCVDGVTKRTIDLAFNEQRVTIEGARRVVVAEAVKRVTQRNFLSHLQANTALQSDLGFSLVSNQSAVKLMKRFKPEIKQERVMSKKEREMDRNKKRKMKEDRNQNYDD